MNHRNKQVVGGVALQHAPAGDKKTTGVASLIAEIPRVADVEKRAEVHPATDDRTLRNVVLNGVRTGQLVVEDGATTLSDEASPQYLSQMAAAVQAPLTLSPNLRPRHVSDTVAFRDKVFPTVAAYLKELDAAKKAINGKYTHFAGLLGNPVTDVEFGGKNYEVAYRKYEYGAIYVPPRGEGPFEVHGAIYQKYLALGAEASFLGFPETDELGTVFGTGRFNHFRGGSIYWTLQTGAWSIHGAIRDQWWALDGDRSYLGFPVSDVERGQVSYFQRGNLQLQSNGSVQDFPDSVILSTSINGGHVKCSTEFWMNSKGDWRHKGHLHNDGFFGCTASVTTSPRFQAADGHVFVVPAERSLGGEMDTEDRNDDWDQMGDDDFLRDDWDIIRFAGISVVLKTNTQIGDVLEVLWPIVVVALVIFGWSRSGKKACPPQGQIRRDPVTGQDVPEVTFQVVDSEQQCPGSNNQDLFQIQQ
jgi:hypothetical protein